MRLNLVTLKLIGLYLLSAGIECAHSDGEVEIPLVSNLDAPLKATLDISKLTRQLRAVISKEIKEEMKSAMSGLVQEMVFNSTLQAQERLLLENSKIIRAMYENITQGLSNIPAFQATVSHDFTPPHHSVIKFDSVKTNIGGSYSSSTGIFTVPRSGLYMFSATIRSYGTHLHCDLFVNETMKMRVHTDGIDTGTGNAVLTVRKGDRVFIRQIGSPGEKMIGREWSMFSGFFIAFT